VIYSEEAFRGDLGKKITTHGTDRRQSWDELVLGRLGAESSVPLLGTCSVLLQLHIAGILIDYLVLGLGLSNWMDDTRDSSLDPTMITKTAARALSYLSSGL
jgi:hypothetical protein